MKKYNIELILKYINGDDIDNYDIEELEDDYGFMLSVIKYTNDKNIYDMCSDNVKGNYNFIKYLINKYSNDINFIYEVTNNFIEYNRNKLERIEILILITNIIPKDNDNYIRYKTILEGMYLVDKFNIEALKKQPSIDIVSDIIQYGFWIIIDDYSNSDIVMKYYAKKFINDIIEEYKINIERDIHNNFNQFKELEEYGINNYLLDLISKYDTNLSSYISCHLELLNDLKKDIDRYKNRWNSYLKIEEERKYNELIFLVHDYIEKHVLEYYFSENYILYYIARELGIDKTLAKYDYIDEEQYKDIINSLPSNLFDKNIVNLEMLKHYNNIKRIMTDILFPNNKAIDNKNKKKGRIIEFKPNK